MSYFPYKTTVENVAELRAFNVQSLPVENGIRPVVQTLGHTTAGDGGGHEWYWDATSTAADNVGTIINPTANAGTGRWLAVIMLNRIDAKWFGVKADGATNDAVAMQAALTVASDNDYTLTLRGLTVIDAANLFAWGKCDIDAPAATFIWSGTMANPEYGFVLGIKSKGGAKVLWTGTMRCSFEVRASSNCARLINAIHASGCVFTVTVDATAHPNVGPFGCYNNGAWATGITRERLTFAECRLIGNQDISSTSGEGIGFGDAAGATITNCHIEGFGDDPIGVHGSTDVIVANNTTKACDGRMYISGSKRVKVVDNIIQRIARPGGAINGGGNLCEISVEVGVPCDDVDVIGNTFVLPAVPTTTYGLRFRGMRGYNAIGNKFDFANNNAVGITADQVTIITEIDVPPWVASTFYAVGLHVIASGNIYRATVAGTSSATAPTHGTGAAVDGSVTWIFVSVAGTAGVVGARGLDPGSVGRLHSGTIAHNVATGPGMVTIEQTGAAANVVGRIDVSNNVVDRYACTSTNFVVDASNEVRPGAAAPFESADVTSPVLATAVGTIAVDSVPTLLSFGATTRWYARRRTAVTSVNTRMPTITAGYFLAELRKNGVAIAGLNFDGDGSAPNGKEVRTNGVPGTTLEVGDYLDIRITKDPSLIPTTLVVSVDVCGVEI